MTTSNAIFFRNIRNHQFLEQTEKAAATAAAAAPKTAQHVDSDDTFVPKTMTTEELIAVVVREFADYHDEEEEEEDSDSDSGSDSDATEDTPQIKKKDRKYIPFVKKMTWYINNLSGDVQKAEKKALNEMKRREQAIEVSKKLQAHNETLKAQVTEAEPYTTELLREIAGLKGKLQFVTKRFKESDDMVMARIADINALKAEIAKLKSSSEDSG